jgi:hypothetical protein
MSTAAAVISYRKTGKGEWVAFGPAAAMRVGTVTVTRKDGTAKTEYVERVGKTFQAGGVDCCYGYLAKTAPAQRRSRNQYEARTCDACEWNMDCGDMMGCQDHRGNPRT